MTEEVATPQSMQSAFERQIHACRVMGSPFTANLLQIILDDFEAGGPTAGLLSNWPREPYADAVPLRIVCALHALVLTDRVPDLAKHYPAAGNPASDALASDAMRVVSEHKDFIADFMRPPLQTNEIGRSSVLIGGFLEIARATGLPFVCFEIGASAGLNQNWDRFFYDLGKGQWGKATSLVHLAPIWRGALPKLNAEVKVLSRAACDLNPVNIMDGTERTRLRSFVWADQIERLKRLDAAIALALKSGVKVDKADAAEWLSRKLQMPGKNVVRVIYHTIMWQYLPQATKDEITKLIEGLAQTATAENPLAWLRFEPDAEGSVAQELTLSLWPDYGTRLLARAHPHGTEIELLGD